MVLDMGLREMVEALERKYGSLNAASRKADIPTTTLFKVKRGADARYSTLLKIAAALGTPLPQLLEQENPDTSRQKSRRRVAA